MKTRLTILILGLVGGLMLGRECARADLEVSAGLSIHAVGEFHEPLIAYGTWVEVKPYGSCWRPGGVAPGWRPYCDGYWEWTDCGWYWQSDEPWAWACYHYGSWFFDPAYGWVWVPGIEWAPAWVCWRTGDDYTGWAPQPPAGIAIKPVFFVFVENRHFCDPVRLRNVIINKPAIFQQTTEVKEAKRGQYRFADGSIQTVVVNAGPDVKVVEKALGKKFTAVPIREADRRTFGSIPKKLRHHPAPPATDGNAGAPDQRKEPPNALTPPPAPPAPSAPPGNSNPDGKDHGKHHDHND